MKNKQYGWIVFGVDDKTHAIINTKYHLDNNFNSVKKQVSDNTTDNITFIEIYNLIIDEKRVIMFQIPAASGTPTNWKGFPYGRSGESLIPLTSNKIEQIKATANYDWSRQVIEMATIENLDPEAIKLAREQFKVKYKGKPIAEEIDNLSDIDFLMNLKGNIEGLEPILVMSAGADAFEAADMAEAFLPMGCKRLLPTRLDLARRFGSILYAAQTNSLGLCDAGTSPHVSQGLCPMDALSLAQMMLSKE